MGQITKEELQRRYDEVKVAIKGAWSQGYAEGLDPNFLLADMKDFIAGDTELGRMDHFVELTFAEWKQENGIA
jgi:hypothetical protein